MLGTEIWPRDRIKTDRTKLEKLEWKKFETVELKLKANSSSLVPLSGKSLKGCPVPQNST